MGGQRLFEEPGDLALIRDVGRYRPGFAPGAADFLGRAFQLVGVAGGQDQPGAFGGIGAGDGLPDAGAGTGYERDAVR